MSSENAVPQQKNNRPGSRLQRAREDRGWSVPQTAEKLHVIPRYVRAIEEGDYNQLPGLVFLKGYVRSYARLVNLSEDRLIEDLEQELLVSGDPMLAQPPASTVPAGFDEQSTKSNRKLGAVVVILALAIGAYVLWDLNQANKSQSPAMTPPASSNSNAITDGSDKADASKSAPAAKLEDASTQTPEALENEPVQVEEPVAETSVEVASVEPESNESGSVPETVENSVAENVVVENTVAGNVESNPETVAEIESVDEAAIVEGAVANEAEQGATAAVKAIFTGDCWFDLRDRDNNRTVGLYRAGDVVDFSGNYPLRFVVGAVDAVSISVAGQPLDFTKYRVRNNRVELVLEQ